MAAAKSHNSKLVDPSIELNVPAGQGLQEAIPESTFRVLQGSSVIIIIDN